jgi:hypothetical protein
METGPSEWNHPVCNCDLDGSRIAGELRALLEEAGAPRAGNDGETARDRAALPDGERDTKSRDAKTPMISMFSRMEKGLFLVSFFRKLKAGKPIITPYISTF